MLFTTLIALPEQSDDMERKSLEIRNLCLKHIDIIFNDLIKRGLIHPESKFFSESKKSTSKTCFQTLYPLIEFFDNFSEDHFDFFLHNSPLFTYAFFLDQSLDSLENNPSTRVRASQISSYLITRYFEYLMKTFDAKITSSFYKYYKEQTDYLIIEKKWNVPQLYTLMYGFVKEIYKKGILLLFPIELCERNFRNYEPLAIKELFVNYFSFILLADDLVDLDFDINHHCLTYPIAMYFKSKGRLPQNLEDMAFIIPQIVEVLREFLENVKKFETDIGQRSLIINDTISRIKNELNTRGFEL